ncbi:MAG: M57 family metalloprotease [Chitinophagaceae bacterium]
MKTLMCIMIVSFAITSCKKEATGPEEISQETMTKISNLGFNTSNVQITEGGYLVEGDIFLSDASLNERPTSPRLRIAEVEQYRTFNLVTGTPRTITVSASGNISSGFSSSIDNAIARYNAQGLVLTFQRVSNNGNINIKIVNTGQYIASAGFPTGGNPYYEIKYANRYTTYSDNFMTTVLTHEMGHCIGFRHTDYMNRAYSCGSGGNEGQETTGVGAVHIPGTPTGPDAASWMLACLSSTTNRPFNNNDITALKYLY